MERPADVAVLGAGVIGCAIAHELASRGAQVIVMDRRRPGAGASQASAGVLAPHIEAESGSALERLGAASLALFDAFVQRVCHESGEAIPYVRDGTLEVATDEGSVAHLERSADALRQRGVACDLLDAAQARTVEPGLGPVVQAALLVPGDGAVQVRALVAALVSSSARRGVRFEAPRTASRVVPLASGAVIECDNGSVRADTVVLAAGAWTSQVVVSGEPPLPITPVRGQLISARATPAAARVIWAPESYVVPWSDGSVLIGATVEHVGFDERPTLGGVRHLSAAACRVLPALDGAVFESVRVGLRPGSPDGLPIIGRATRAASVVYATGHYRNGILLAPFTARAVADLVTGQPRQDPLLLTVAPARLGL